MDLELFRKVISDLQFPMDPTQTANLFEIFRNAQNKMNYAQMMTVLRGEMNEHRRGFVSKAFQRQRNRQGQVLLGALLRNYQSDNHPYVLSEVISQEEAKEEFEDNLQILLGNEEGDLNFLVSQEQFTDFYRSYSAIVEDEEEFEDILTLTWDLTRPLDMTPEDHRQEFRSQFY